MAQAIRTGSSNQVDLPLEAQTATISAITMADNANADDLDLPPIPTQMSLEELADGGLDDDPEAARADSWDPGAADLQSRKSEITLAPEDGDMAFDFQVETGGLVDPTDMGGNAFGDDAAEDKPFGDDGDIEVARDSAGGHQIDFDALAVDPSDSFADDGQARVSEIQQQPNEDINASDPNFLNEDSMPDDNLFGGVDGIAFDQSSRRSSRPKRRRMELDTETEIKAQQIKQQLADTTDIVRDFVQAPCTRKELQAQEGATVDFSRPLVSGNTLAPELLEMFAALIPKSLEADAAEEAEEDVDPLFNPEVQPNKRRKSEGEPPPRAAPSRVGYSASFAAGEDEFRGDDQMAPDNFGELLRASPLGPSSSSMRPRACRFRRADAGGLDAEPDGRPAARRPEPGPGRAQPGCGRGRDAKQPVAERSVI